MRHFLITVVIICFFAACAEKPSEPSDKEPVPFAVSQQVIGFGVDIRGGYQQKAKVWPEPKIVPSVPGGKYESGLKVRAISNESQLYESLGIDIRAEASSLTWNANASFTHYREALNNQNSIIIEVSSTYFSDVQTISPTESTLPPTVPKMKPENFFATYGTHFVQQIVNGSRVSILLTLKNVSSTVVSNMKAKFSGGIKWGGGSGSAEAAFSKEFNSSVKQGWLNFEVRSVGYELPMEAFNPFWQYLQEGSVNIHGLMIEFGKLYSPESIKARPAMLDYSLGDYGVINPKFAMPLSEERFAGLSVIRDEFLLATKRITKLQTLYRRMTSEEQQTPEGKKINQGIQDWNKRAKRLAERFKECREHQDYGHCQIVDIPLVNDPKPNWSTHAVMLGSGRASKMCREWDKLSNTSYCKDGGSPDWGDGAAWIGDFYHAEINGRWFLLWSPRLGKEDPADQMMDSSSARGKMSWMSTVPYANRFVMQTIDVLDYWPQGAKSYDQPMECAECRWGSNGADPAHYQPEVQPREKPVTARNKRNDGTIVEKWPSP